MRISYKHKFIFIHVDRTGGTSVSRTLDAFSYNMSDIERLYVALRRRLGFSTDNYRWKRFSTQHVTARELKAQYPREIFDNYFKFAFVRNPWDWLVSIYYARLQHPAHPEYELAKYLNSFEKYAVWWVRNKRTRQIDYLVDEQGSLLLDFVGKFERLEEDFAHICKVLGIQASLPHHNTARYRAEKNYHKYYSQDTKMMIAEACQDDIEYFNYTF